MKAEERKKYLAFIKFEDISFSYPGQEKLIEDLTLEFEKGQFTAVMGENGSGKTTIGKLMVGILKPISGAVFLGGENLSDISLGRVGSRVGYLFQNPELQIFATTVAEELSFIPELKDIEEEKINSEVNEVLNLFSLSSKKESIIYNLSYGEKQRLALAGILINKPEYIILDEPTTGLDFLRRQQLLSIMKELLLRGIGMTVISHDEKFIKNFKGNILKVRRDGIVRTSIKKL